MVSGRLLLIVHPGYLWLWTDMTLLSASMTLSVPYSRHFFCSNIGLS